MKRIASIIPFLFITGCISASLEDDIAVQKQLDFSSSISQQQASIPQLQALCSVQQQGVPLPSQCTAPQLISISQEKDIDVSDELKKFSSESMGMSYALSGVTIDVNPTACVGDCLSHVNGITATLGSCTLVNAAKFGTFAVGDTECVKHELESGPTKLQVGITLGYTGASGLQQAFSTLPTTYDAKLSMHVAVNVEKKF